MSNKIFDIEYTRPVLTGSLNISSTFSYPSTLFLLDTQKEHRRFSSRQHYIRMCKNGSDIGLLLKDVVTKCSIRPSTFKTSSKQPTSHISKSACYPGAPSHHNKLSHILESRFTIYFIIAHLSNVSMKTGH